MRPPHTTRDLFNETLCTLKATFAAGRTKDTAWRKWQLKQLWWMVADNEQRIIDALKHDLNRSEAESRRLELFTLKADILSTLKSFEAWAADEKPGSWKILNRMLGVHIRKEPLGVALIIGSWNYPFLLLLQPVVAAIAAGCCVVMKPSELATALEQLLAELVSTYLDGSAVMLATGGPEEMAWILECQYDHIFFTGSSRTARVIAAAAARHLTPTVLELGGQGPAIVCKTANVDLAAKRIAWAKAVNAGQICLTVNHVFADPCIYDEFAQRLRHWMTVFEAQSGGVPSIINEGHFDRVQGLLGSTHGTVMSVGQADRERLAIPLTVVTDVTLKGTFTPLQPRLFALSDLRVTLTESVYGLQIPSCPKSSLGRSAQSSKQQLRRLRPLSPALYVFSNDRTEVQQILDGCNSGGVTVNDCLMHAAVGGAPFGGVGESGHGYYHGVHGFLTFTHTRVVMASPTWLDRLLSPRYPPYALPWFLRPLEMLKAPFKRGETLEDQRRDKNTKRFLAAKLLAPGLVLSVAFLSLASLRSRGARQAG